MPALICVSQRIINETFFCSLSLNATKLSGDIFLNFFLGTIADCPTIVIFYFTLDRFGRKWNMVFFQALLGLR